MRTILPTLVVAVSCFSSAHAQFTNKSFGEGGGYKHPDKEASQYLEAKPVAGTGDRAELDPKYPSLPAKDAAPGTEPAAKAPSRPRPRPFAPLLVKSAPQPAKTVASAAAAAAGVGDEAAGDDARRDYESKILGAPSVPRRPGLAESKAPASPAAPAAMGEGMLFVSLELDAQEAGSLRDAVAGLGAAAAFRPDARFQPTPGEGGGVRISGWLPASRLGDAISRRGVKRVAVERGSRPASDERVTGDYKLTLRVSDTARPEESVATSVRELTERTGFKLGRVFGFETAPGGAATALVTGTMPVSQLSRALAMPDVLRLGSADPAPSSASAPAPSGRGFMDFVLSRALWLIVLTLLLALPAIGDVVKKGLSVFVPYR